MTNTERPEEQAMTEAEVRAERLELLSDELLSENIRLKQDLAAAIQVRDDRWTRHKEVSTRLREVEAERDQLRLRVLELEGPGEGGQYDSYRLKVVQLRKAKSDLSKLRLEYSRVLAEREAFRQASISSHDLVSQLKGEIARLQAIAGSPGPIQEAAGTEWSETEYRAAFAELERLMELNPDKESPEGRRLLDLSFEIEDYEQLHYPIAPPTKEEAEAFRREQEGTVQR